MQIQNNIKEIKKKDKSTPKLQSDRLLNELTHKVMYAHSKYNSLDENRKFKVEYIKRSSSDISEQDQPKSETRKKRKE